MSDPTLDRAPNPAYSISAESPVPAPQGEYRFTPVKKGDDWVFLDEAYSLVPYPGFEVDPKYVKAIQAIDPELTPVWVKLSFLSPSGSVESFVRNALGRTFSKPDHINYDVDMQGVLLPLHRMPWRVRKPHIMAAVFRDGSAPNVIPGIEVKPYVPYSQAVVDEIKVQHDAWRDAEQAQADAERMRDTRAYRDAQVLAKADAEADYRWDSDNRSRDIYSAIRDMPGRELEEAAAMTRGAR